MPHSGTAQIWHLSQEQILCVVWDGVPLTEQLIWMPFQTIWSWSAAVFTNIAAPQKMLWYRKERFRSLRSALVSIQIFVPLRFRILWNALSIMQYWAVNLWYHWKFRKVLLISEITPLAIMWAIMAIFIASVVLRSLAVPEAPQKHMLQQKIFLLSQIQQTDSAEMNWHGRWMLPPVHWPFLVLVLCTTMCLLTGLTMKLQQLRRFWPMPIKSALLL